MQIILVEVVCHLAISPVFLRISGECCTVNTIYGIMAIFIAAMQTRVICRRICRNNPTAYKTEVIDISTCINSLEQTRAVCNSRNSMSVTMECALEVIRSHIVRTYRYVILHNELHIRTKVILCANLRKFILLLINECSEPQKVGFILNVDARLRNLRVGSTLSSEVNMQVKCIFTLVYTTS